MSNDSMKEPRRDAVNALNEAFQEAARLFTLAAQEQRLHADLETVATQTVQFSRVAERCSPAETAGVPRKRRM